jgi:hypothetical protein
VPHHGEHALQAEIRFEDEEPTAALPTEGPWNVANYFKQLAFGDALIHDRMVITASDLDFISEVAISSTPGHLRNIIRALRTWDAVDTALAAELCGVSCPTARKYLTELHVLGIVNLAKGVSDLYIVTLRDE